MPTITFPPTQDELPYSDGAPMESNLHVLQMILLIETLDGSLISTPQEKAEQERQRANELEEMLARYREQFGELPE